MGALKKLRGWRSRALFLTEADFHDFVFGFPAQYYAGQNRAFFNGTRVEDAVKKLFDAER